MTERTPTSDRAFARDLAKILAREGYDEPGIKKHLPFDEEGLELNSESMPRFLRATAGDRPLDVLIRLFALGRPVRREHGARVAEPMSLESWQSAGLVRLDGDLVHPTVSLAPQHDMLLAFDLVPADAGRTPDHVMGLATSSTLLLRAAVPGQEGAVLDLGTGCGGTAIAHAAHAKRVVATDLNARAVAFARFNAHLNGADNIEVRQGSLFEPVAGETFDRITMNAPYVISPDARFTYRDGGEALVRAVLAAAPQHLSLGGVCQITAQWAHVEGQPWPARLATWVKGLPFDTWVIRTRSRTVETHAENWISETEQLDRETYRRRTDEWVTWFRDQGITGVSTGLFTLRRRDEPGWFDVTQDDMDLDQLAGAVIADGLRTRDHVNRADAQTLMSTAFRLADGVELRQVLAPTGQGWQGTGVRLHTTRGLRLSVDIDDRIAWLVGQVDGQRPMAQLVEQLAEQLGVEVARLAQPMLTVTRLLIDKGFLVVG